MSRLKTITAYALTAAVVFQLITLPASAATALTGDSGDDGVVRIGLTSKPAVGSDFTKAPPKGLFVCNPATVNPWKKTADSDRTEYDTIPQYYQADYPDALYGDGTVATHGSSVTALAMMATFLTGYDYKPDDLACWFAEKSYDDEQRLTYASAMLGLPYATTSSWEWTLTQLQAGKYAIIQTNEDSLFSDSQHFVVLKGVTEDGKILVNDPCIENVLNPDLSEKYTDGFDETEISSGFCLAWTYDPKAVDDEISYYMGTQSNGYSRYASLHVTAAEKQLLARAVYIDADGKSEEGRQMLVEIILNRVLSEKFPDTLKQVVCGADGLYDTELLNAAEPTDAEYLAVERALYGPYMLDTSVTDFDAFRQ